MAEQDLAAQVRAMRSVRDFDRLKAAGAFEEMSADVVEALIGAFRRERPKKQMRLWLAVVLFSALALVGAKLVVIRLAGPGADASLLLGAMFPVAFGAAAAGAATPLQRRLSVLLGGCGDIRAIGPMVDILERQESALRAMVVGPLTRLLPRMVSDDGQRLTAGQRKRLASAMLLGPPEFALAAIGALTRIGDTSCRGRVARLAAGKGIARRNATLRQAALEAIGKLDATLDKERLAETLLRAADAPADATLLRPAGSPAAGDETMLLRPADAGGGYAVEVSDTHA